MKFNKFFLTIFFFSNFISGEKCVYIAIKRYFLNDKLFTISGYKKIKEILALHDINIHTLDKAKKLEKTDCVIFIDSQHKSFLEKTIGHSKKNLILFVLEPPTVISSNNNRKMHNNFGTVYTWDDRLVDDKKYFKLFYPKLRPYCDNPYKFDEKKLCTMIAKRRQVNDPNDLNKARKAIISFFEKIDENVFDFYGLRWGKKYKNYKGIISTYMNNSPMDFCFLDDFDRIPQKIQILQKYKFCICYENTKDLPGYITEKIFDCFAAGCVPVYWGAPNIENYIPENCFIDKRKFNTIEDLYLFLRNMSEEEHNQFLLNIQKFLKSEEAFLFSGDNYARIFCDTIFSVMLS